MNATVLVPVKSLYHAKSRLAPYLTVGERSRLVMRMLAHVITVLKNDGRFLIYVVSTDTRVGTEAEEMGVGVMYTPQSGQNRSLAAAAALMRPDTPLLALSADLPFLSQTDLDSLLIAVRDNDLVLGASKEKTGTNAVFMKKPGLTPYLFGRNSLAKFRDAGNRRHLKTAVLESPGISLDIDTADDVMKLQETGMFLTGL